MPDIPLPKPIVPQVGSSPMNGTLPPESAEDDFSPAGTISPSPLPLQSRQPLPASPGPAPSSVILPPASVGALSSLSNNSLPLSATGNVPGPVPGSAPGAPPQSAPPSGVPLANGGKPGATPTPTKSDPQFAKHPNPLLKLLPWIGGVVVLGIIAFVVYTRFFSGGSAAPAPKSGAGIGSTATPAPAAGASGQPITLEYWGLWEPEGVMTEVLKDFEKANPGVQVRYTKQSHRDYRERLQTAVASGNGPDLFRFHATWTSMLKEELAPMPSSVYTTAEFQEIFYPVAYKQLQHGGQLMGVPLMYDGLELFYNKKMFETAGIEPPKTWVELRNAAKALTLTEGSAIKRGGVALGTTKNVDHFSDILAYLLLQNGADLKKPNSPETKDALSFYTNFVTTDKVWNDQMPSSTVAFAREDVAMIFAPSWRVHDIVAMNKDISFGVVSLPKLGSEQLGWANYWAEGVNSKGKNKQTAWNLLKYLSSAEVQQKLYSNISKTRTFGEIYSRKDLADSLAGAPYVEAFLQDAPNAQSWYLTSNTFDKGINDQIIKYYEDAINASVQGKTMDTILQTLDLGTTQVLRQYNATGSN